ncbi:MAG: CDP-2,3-bis-(O-geranylgeranyl)-sn-glycerol synthase [Promethearchaeota archaeon]
MIFYMSMWIIFPAYLANAVVVPLSRKKRFHPMDLGRSWRGHRILGDGKTFEGFFLGSCLGFTGGTIQFILSPLFLQVTKIVYEAYHPILLSTYEIDAYFNWDLKNFGRALLLPIGAMSGDVLGSFIKRRLGIHRGARAPILDQLDFITGAILFSFFLIPVNGSLIQISWHYITTIVILTPAIHRATNKFAYRIGIKNVDH